MNRSRVTGDLTASGLLYADIANDRVGIGSTIPGNKLSLPDNAKIGLGNAEDLEIFHNGSHNIIKSNNGDLYLQDNSYIEIGHPNGTVAAGFIPTGAVNLRHNGSTKLETTSSGVSVTGSTVISGDLDVAADIRHTGDTDTRLRFETDTITARTAGSERLRINSSGQLVAGATVSGAEGGNTKLCIVGTGSVGVTPSSIASSTLATFRMTGGLSHAAGISILAGSDGSSAINLGDRDNELIGRILYNHTSGNSTDYMAFYVQGSEKLQITSAGIVQLPVGANQRIGIADRHNSTGVGHTLTISPGGGYGSGKTSGDLLLSRGRGLGGAAGGAIKFGYNAGDNTAGLDQVQMILDVSGKVGIGTDNPTDILDVYSTTDPCIRSRSGSSSVGALMEICGGASNDSLLVLSSGTTSKYQIFRDGSQSDDLRIYDTTNSLDIMRYRHGGYLHFGVNGQERLRIDSSGNIGQSVTPSGWASAQAGDFYAFQIGTGMAIFGRGSGDEDRGGISCNYYNTASAQKYIGNGHAGRIYFEDGSIVFSNAAQNSSGAGAAMTLNERLRIDSSGRLLLGTDTAGDSTADDLTIANSAVCGITIRSGTSSEGNIFFADGTSGDSRYRGMLRYDHNDDAMIFKVTGSERLRIRSNGVVVINNSSGSTLEMTRTSTSTTGMCGKIVFGNTDWDSSMASIQSYQDGANDNASLRFYTQPSGGAETERFRITSAGKFGFGTTSPYLDKVCIKSDVSAGTHNWALHLLNGTHASDSRVGLAFQANNNAASNTWDGAGIYAANDGSTGACHTMFGTVIDGSFTERLRLDSSGRLLLGATSDVSPDSFGSLLQIDSGGAAGSIALGRHTNSGSGPALLFHKSRSGSGSGATIVQDGDNLGTIRFYGADGTDRNSYGANISANVDGTPGSNDLPGNLVFSTTADGAASSTERLRIASDGKIGFGDFSSGTALLNALHFKNAMGSSPSWIHMEVTGSNTVGGGGGIAFDTSASNTASNNGYFLATIAGVRNSSDDGSNDLVFSTSKNGVSSSAPVEKLRIKSDSSILHTRTDNSQRYDLEFRQTGGISTGNYSGVKWTQGSTGSTFLAGILMSYHDTGRPDMVFYHRDEGGGTGSDEVMRLDRDGVLYFNSGYGSSAKAYGIRAWINFDMTNSSIRDSGNVASVTDHGTGDFAISFSNNIVDNDYAIGGTATNWEGTNSDSYCHIGVFKDGLQSSSFRIKCIRSRFDQQPPQFRDSNEVMLTVTR